jgi:putative inorganic carbon (hco3(-)) transporter
VNQRDLARLNQAVFGQPMTLRPPASAVAAVGVVLGILAVWLSRVWIPGFFGLVLLLLALVAYAALRWPRTILVLVAMGAILDRYVVAGLLPSSLGFATHVTSEALLAIVGLVLTWEAWRSGRLLPALLHPASAFLAVFLAIALLSALVNRVPASQAIAGVLFTIDAAALFYLVRMVGFNLRQALLAAGALVGLLVAASVIGLLQAILDPKIFGLTALFGRFGETYRIASIFGDPNVFSALLSMGLPFVAMTAVRAPLQRDRRIAFALLLVLSVALWLTFSRGGWLGMLAGFTFATLILDRRAWLVGSAVLAVALVIALVMPRNLAVAKSQNSTPPNPVGSTVNRIETVGAGRDLRTLFGLNGIPILASHSLVGVGPGRYGGAAADIFGTPVYAEYGTNLLFTRQTQTTVDNFWLHLFVEFGVLGALAFFGMMLTAVGPIFAIASRTTGWWRVALVGIAAAAATVVINSLTTMLLESNSVSFVFWFLLGLGSLLAGAAASELAAAHDLPEGAQHEAEVAEEGA